MFDRPLRPTTDRVLAPVAARLGTRIAPIALSTTGAALCVAASVLAWQRLAPVAVACWLLGRFLDGLDGPLARRRGTASDFGGIADLLLDSVGYAAVPIGLAAGADNIASWTIVAVLLATFYINSVSLLMLSAVLEKRSAGAAHRAETRAVTMPPSLVEGTETIVAFTLALAVPRWADGVFIVMALAITLGVAQRTVAARRLLA